jgi:hypothetical protein
MSLLTPTPLSTPSGPLQFLLLAFVPLAGLVLVLRLRHAAVLKDVQ